MLNTEKKQQVIKEFGTHSQDTGSSAVQIAVLTAEIKELTEHLKNNQKDFSSKRGLLNKVAQRRNLLNYVARHNDAQYKELVQRLELRK